MSTPLKPGQCYYGPGEQRLRLLRVEDGVVRCEWPVSHTPVLMPLPEFEEWIAGSGRRNYYHENGEMRTRRHLDLKAGTVTYMTPGHEEVVTVPLEEWNEWRKGA